MSLIDSRRGRALFGFNPLGYDEVRPDYPDELYDLLPQACSPVLEIGPGSGIATGRLLERGLTPILALEPDSRFHPQLEDLSESYPEALELSATSFEEADLAPGSFGLIVAATAFHWLDPHSRARRMKSVLRPDGYVLLLWNIFQDMDEPDLFHEATAGLLRNLASSPSGKPDERPFALQREVLEAEFEQAGFESASYRELRWPLILEPRQVRQLYETFSSIQLLPATEREVLLDALQDIAEKQFHGRVTRNMTSVGYLFREVR